MSKRVIVCADDYGFDADVSGGILDCVDAAVVSAVSCMTLSPHWPAQAKAIASRRHQADFGLHLDVNEFAGYAPGRSLSGWIVEAYTRQIGVEEARQWVDAQLDAFEDGAGMAPRFVDGHQHVHQLPVLRSAVLDAMAARYGTACALRDGRPRHWRGAKAQLIGMLGARSLERAARHNGLLSNHDFAGVYEFSTARPYGDRVANWLATLDDGGMLMTHPSRASSASVAHDPIRAARQSEHAWWLSPAAKTLLDRMEIKVVRFDALSC